MSISDPRHAYVRFYLAVLAQLDEVATALGSTATQVREAVTSFADVLATSDDADLRRVLEAHRTPPSTADLWRPRDVATLSGLTDVYEVVGRFAFQGEDDANLDRVALVVHALGDEIDRQRRALAALARLPASATRHAEGLSQQEIAAAEAERAKRLEPFEPVAEQLRVQCGRVLDAVRQVARPDLAKPDAADALYRDYVRRVQALYAAALPYLRRALADLCGVAQVEVPASWPDALPFAPSLPPELLAEPGSASSTLADLATRDAQCVRDLAEGARMVDELALEQRKLEGDKVALLGRETEIMADVRVAKDLVRWATKYAEIEQAAQGVAAQEQQKRSRAQLVAQLEVHQEQLEAQLEALRAEGTQREADVAASEKFLEKERTHPPALFGKDEWRRRVTDLEAELEEQRNTLTARLGSLEQTTVELSNVRARVAAEKAQIALGDRSIDDAREREKALRGELAKIEEQLGAQRPAHEATVAQADEYLTRTWAARNDLRARLDAATGRLREIHEQADRLATQSRQLEAERAQLARSIAQARTDATAAHGAALDAQAVRRREGFAKHVDQVLAPLDESLTQVDRIFVEPARQVLLQRSVGEAPKAGSLRAQAEGLAQAVAQLAPRVEPVLAAQVEALKRVQADFCDRVKDAVRGAWAS